MPTKGFPAIGIPLDFENKGVHRARRLWPLVYIPRTHLASFQQLSHPFSSGLPGGFNSPATLIIMKVFVVLSALIVAITAQRLVPDYRQAESYAPIPYSFSYAADLEDGGGSSHQEQGDGSGRVQGSYTVTNDEGHTRVVDYVADEAGFRATVRTNEPGTANQNPADVVVESTADDQQGLRAPVPARPQVARRPVVAPVAPAAGGRAGVRYVLVPITDPRAAGYY